MRARRGNYMIMFAFLLPILLAFMAFSIDIGRLRVAKVQVESSADGAALAALATVRDGGSRGDALAASGDLANLTRLTRFDGETAPAQLFNTELTWGDWDWETQTWTDDGGSTAGVTANLVQQGTGLSFLFAPIFQTTKWFEGGAFDAGTSSPPKHKFAVGKRAAMRPRDIVVVVDVSRGGLMDELPNVQDALGNFLDAIDDMQNPWDRVGVVVYAGASARTSEISPLNTDFPAVRDALTDTEHCRVDKDAWYHFYRYYDFSVFDFEWGSPTWNYRFVDPTVSIDGDKGMNIPWASFEQIWFSAPFGATYWTAANWNQTLTDVEECSAWVMSEFLFEAFDPRRQRRLLRESAGLSPAAGAVTCDEGNYYESRGDRFDASGMFELDPADCGFGDIEEYNDKDGLGVAQTYGEGEAGPLVGDRAYSYAGSNPAAGLSEAYFMLDEIPENFRERTVVLVTSKGPNCGPLIETEGVIDSLCEADWTDETYDALDLLDDLGANVHVVALTTTGSDDDIFLSGLTAGRGKYLPTDNIGSLQDQLIEVARDVRLQVVE